MTVMVYPTTEIKYPEVFPVDKICPAKSSPAVFDSVDAAVDACLSAQLVWSTSTVELRKSVIASIRQASRDRAKDLAWAAWSETGRGRYEDKIAKNLLCANSTPGVEDIVTECVSGDHGITFFERAPMGVVGALTPVTNPTSTIINNSISILAGGNGVVFNAHPSAQNCTSRAVAIVNDAVVAAGGPSCLVTAVLPATIAGAEQLIRHPKTSVTLVTGGPHIVKIAMTAGKRAICAGPGNPPCVIDETADVGRAARGIIQGASFDNNMICTDEKTCIAVDAVAEKLKKSLIDDGRVYWATPEELKKLEKVVFKTELQMGKETPINTEFVGKNASEILAKIGVKVKDDIRLIMVDVPNDHPLIWSEQLMPVIPLTRTRDVESAIKLAKESEKGYRHTCSMYSTNVDNLTKMGKAMNTTIFVKNGPCLGGLGVDGEGFTSFSIAGTTGEGMTRPRTFTRERRLTVIDSLRMV